MAVNLHNIPFGFHDIGTKTLGLEFLLVHFATVLGEDASKGD